MTDLLKETNPFSKRKISFEEISEKYKNENQPMLLIDFIWFIGISNCKFIKDWVTMVPNAMHILDEVKKLKKQGLKFWNNTIMILSKIDDLGNRLMKRLN